jgi:hypothetical protein
VLYTADGIAFAAGATGGVKLVSNTGTLIRQLPVPGVAAGSCRPVRWWTAGTVLVTCPSAYNDGYGRLWVVPVSGQLPVALTSRPGPDTPVTVDAWRLNSGLYVQSFGASDISFILRQAPDGPATTVTGPGPVSDAYVVASDGSSLLVQAWMSTEWSYSLLWFNPATGARKWLVKTPVNAQGVTAAIAFDTEQNALSRPR